MKIYESIKAEFFISTDKNKLDVAFIQNYLGNESYWAKNIPLETVQKSIDGSFCFGLFVNKNSGVIKPGTKNFEQTLPTGLAPLKLCEGEQAGRFCQGHY